MAVTQYNIFIRYLNESVNKPLTNTTQTEWVSALDWADMQEFYSSHQSEYNQINAAILNGTKRLSDLTSHEVLVYEKCAEYMRIKNKIIQDDGSIVLENLFIRGYDDNYFGRDQSAGRRRIQRKKELNAIAARMTEITTEGVVPQNDKYDMLFMYTGVGSVTFPGWHIGAETAYPAYFPWESRNDTVALDQNTDYGSTPQDHFTPEVFMEHMKRVQLDPWFFHSQHASLKSAMNKATELVNLLGKDAVKIGKVVALDQYIDIV